MNGLAQAPAARRERPLDLEAYFGELTDAYEHACSRLDACQAVCDRDGAKPIAQNARELRREINRIAKRLFGAGSTVARLLTLDFRRTIARRQRQWH